MPTFDAVYPLGKGSKIRNLEIFFSLRSLAMHAQNLGKVYVIGERPNRLKWSDRLIHVPFTETSNRYKNIWEKALAAANYPNISERFIWMNDDFFILEDFNAGEVPYFGRAGGLKPTESTGYQRTLKKTYDSLMKRGLTTNHFGTHQPINFEKEKIKELFKEFEPDIDAGISLRIAYGNYFKCELTPKTTDLIHKGMPSTRNRFALSSHASVTAKLLRSELKKLYPERSEFEYVAGS